LRREPSPPLRCVWAASPLKGDDIYWIEGRPDEGGRNVVVKRTADGCIADVTPEGINVRTRVHGYGGAAFVVDSARSLPSTPQRVQHAAILAA
jgi:hypothetical protein